MKLPAAGPLIPGDRTAWCSRQASTSGGRQPTQPPVRRRGASGPTARRPRPLAAGDLSLDAGYRRVGSGPPPGWWNRQTRRTQNPLPERACGFKSRPGHSRGPPGVTERPGASRRDGYEGCGCVQAWHRERRWLGLELTGRSWSRWLRRSSGLGSGSIGHSVGTSSACGSPSRRKGAGSQDARVVTITASPRQLAELDRFWDRLALLLPHPGLARIAGRGVTACGWPWVVTEDGECETLADRLGIPSVAPTTRRAATIKRAQAIIGGSAG